MKRGPKSKIWTPEKIKELESLLETESKLTTIERKLGVSKRSLYLKMKELGLKSVWSLNRELVKTGSRKCSICMKIKPVDDFYTFESQKTGKMTLHNFCKTCFLERNKARISSSKLHFFKYLCYRSKGRAKRLGLQHSLTPQDILDKYDEQKGLCYFSGVKLELSQNCNETTSIDRLDSGVGYIPDNIVLCTKRINQAKNDMNVNDFINMCIHVSNFSHLT